MQNSDITDFWELPFNFPTIWLVGWERTWDQTKKMLPKSSVKAGFMKSRWLFFTTDQWIRNGRNLKAQRICRGNLTFYSGALCAVYLNLGNLTHSFRRLELRNDSTRQDDKARQCDFLNSGRRHVENWKSSSSGWRIRFYRVSRNRMAFLPSNRKELWHDIELLT